MSVQSVALASLTATYTDSEGEDGHDDNLQENSNTPTGGSVKSYRSSSNSPTDNSNTSVKNNLTNAPTDPVRMQRLVSYFDDTIVSDDEGTAAPASERLSSMNGRQHSEVNDQQPPSRHLLSDEEEADPYGVVIPPEPTGTCPSDLQEKITNLYKKMESARYDMNKLIQQRKDFRNPSIYEKLIQFCNINELGTNYPPDRFDPFKWSKESYYEELAKVQKVEMEKLEKARKDKAKVEIVSGTAKRPAGVTITTEEEAKKRKSKWDQVNSNPLAAAAAVKTTAISSTLTTLTATATGTKTTVISAFGSVPKKRL